MNNISKKYVTIQKSIILFIIVFATNLNLINSCFARRSNVFTNRYAEIIIDGNNGNTIFSVNENARRYPASLTKLMTLYLLFDSIKTGRVSLNTPIPVSKYAASRPPTKIGFSAGQTINAQNAAKAMITKSANDVAAAVAEYLGGTERNFAKMMTLQAHRLGMMNTHFNNASGLPDIHNYTTARDLATLCLALRNRFPHLYSLFKTTSFRYNGRTINGHNHILKNMPGVDGLKTGYTQMSGFNLATSYYAHNKNIVAVIMGWRSAALRDARMSSLLRKFVPKSSQRRYNSNSIPLPNFKPNPNFRIINIIQQENANPIRSSLYQIKPKNIHKSGIHKPHTVQIGIAKTKNEAEKIYKKISRRNKLLFKKYNKIIVKINNKKIIYRIRLTNIINKREANHICKILQKQKFRCFVVN